MSQLVENNNEKNVCITKELSKTKIINDCKMSNNTDININKFKQKYTNNKLIRSSFVLINFYNELLPIFSKKIEH